MSIAKIYRQYVYIAGIQIPILSTVVSSQLGSVASLSVSINYSPFITHIYEYAKIQLWEQMIEQGILLEPTLQFDGIIIGIQRRKNLLGEVSVTLNCLTDGAIWNIRKQADFYLSDIVSADYRGTGDVLNMRVDGQVFNYFAESLRQNQFDIGCCIASVLTSYVHRTPDKNADGTNTKADPVVTNYEYSFNGKNYKKSIVDSDSSTDKDANPPYYNKFLDTYKLANKVYGVSTTDIFKNYFKEDTFINCIMNTQNDVYGENTFWQLATTIAQYGFFSVYDIPNPTFIDTDNGSEVIDVNTCLPNELLTASNLDSNGNQIPLSIPTHPEITTLLTPDNKNKLKHKKSYKGLAEYIFKPISVMGIPFKCNVIWPDQVLEESIFYDFFNTPSRVLYKRSPIPGLNKNIFTTQTVVGPDFNGSGFLKSMTLKREPNTIRDPNVLSNYEIEYGIKPHSLNLTWAFDSALLNGLDGKSEKDPEVEVTIEKVSNYLNYEYAQKFLSSRTYSIMVTPDCDPIPGFPLIVLNKMGEHVIAFCTGIRKAWSASGVKNVSLSVSYPRYYFEDFGDLGNVIDTISQDQNSLDEVSILIGSQPIGKLSATNKDHKAVVEAITDLFSNYQGTDNEDIIKLKQSYRRQTCTYSQYMNLFNQIISPNIITDMPIKYPISLFDSSENANTLSSHYFEVYDSMSNQVISYQGLSNSQIVNNHLEWIKNPKRI